MLINCKLTGDHTGPLYTAQVFFGAEIMKNLHQYIGEAYLTDSNYPRPCRRKRL